MQKSFIAKTLDTEDENLYDSWVTHFCSFMFWNKSDHKKYGFVLVLYLFRDINSFKSEKGDNIKLYRLPLQAKIRV